MPRNRALANEGRGDGGAQTVAGAGDQVLLMNRFGRTPLAMSAIPGLKSLKICRNTNDIFD
jgi:hypothetical protein